MAPKTYVGQENEEMPACSYTKPQGTFLIPFVLLRSAISMEEHASSGILIPGGGQEP